MIFEIPDILAPKELEYITSSLTEAEFVDGKLIAGWHGKLVKNNHQLKYGEFQQQLQELIKKALSRNTLFQMAVCPKISHSRFYLAART